MGEQSHLEAMREAVRGDLERARSRRPSIFERPAAKPVEIRQEPPPEQPPLRDSGPVEGPSGEPGGSPVNDAAAEELQPVAAEPQPEPAVEPPEEPCNTVLQGTTGQSEPAVEPEPAAGPRRRWRLAFWRR